MVVTYTHNAYWERGEICRVNWWVWLPVWSADRVSLPVLSVSVPCGVSQVTTPVTSVSTVGGSVAVHVSMRSEPARNTDAVGGVVSVTVAIGTAE